MKTDMEADIAIKKDDLFIKPGIIISAHELIFTASRAGGPGGQHVNKTSTKITLRWNITQSQAFSNEEKARILSILASEITSDGDIIIHSSSSRSQQQNKKAALSILAQKLAKALYIPKKRIKTKIPKNVQEKRLESKKARGMIKKMRKPDFE